MKKLFVWILSAALCVSLAACAGKTPSVPASVPADGETRYGRDSAARAAMEWEGAYEEKFDTLEQEHENEKLYRTIVPCGTGEKILAVTSSVYADGQTIEADIYQYADGEVKYIASLSSTGTAYPLAFTEEAILFGGNHTAGKLVVRNGTAELYQLVNMNIEGRTPVLEIYDVADGEKTLKSSEELSPEDADSFDYYTNAFAEEKAEIILFTDGTETSSESPEEENNTVSAEALQTLFTDMTGYRGNAGSSLRNAQEACHLLAFAENADYANINPPDREKAVSAAYSAMSVEQKEEFASNFSFILDLMESASGDDTSARGLFDDAGVADTMDYLMNAENAYEQWDALSSDILTVAAEFFTDLDAGESAYASVTTLDKKEVEEFASKVRRAYLDEDWQTISAMIRYPITMYPDRTVNNAEEFLSYMSDKMIADEDRTEMEEEDCKDLFANGQGICMGTGNIWFLDVNFDGIRQIESPLLRIISVSGIVSQENQ